MWRIGLVVCWRRGWCLVVGAGQTTLHGLDLAEDWFDGAAALGVAGLAFGAVQPARIAARRLSLLDSEGLPSLRGLPWRPWRAGGINNSGASGIADTLAIDQ